MQTGDCLLVAWLDDRSEKHDHEETGPTRTQIGGCSVVACLDDRLEKPPSVFALWSAVGRVQKPERDWQQAY